MRKKRFFLAALLLSAAAAHPCLFDNFYAGEAEWVQSESWLVECLSSYFTKDRVSINVLERELRQAYPHVVWQFNTLPIMVDAAEMKNKARAPITLVKNSGEGFSITVARFEKSVPTVKDFAPLVQSGTKSAIADLLKRKEIVLLVLTGKSQTGNKALAACAKKAAKMTSDMVGIRTHVLTAGLYDPKEKYLADNILWGKKGKRAGILMLFGMGKALYFLDNPKSPNLIMEMAHKLDLETNTEAHDLLPRLLINMPVPDYIREAGIKAQANKKNKPPQPPKAHKPHQEDPNRSLEHLMNR